MLPEVGKVYNFYDDGKVRPSRHELVTITDIKKFDDVDSDIKKIIEDEQKERFWLYKPQTDYVIFGETNMDMPDPNYMFIRTKDDGWFGVGKSWADGRLDVDRKLTEQLIKDLENNRFFSKESLEDFLTEIV